MLVEKLALALAVAATQHYGAALQVVLAQAVLFVALQLQWLFCPYACRMLDTMQRRSLFALIVTCFTLMAPALDGLMQPSLGGLPRTWVLYSALAVAGVVNLVVVALFLYAMALEGRRMALAVLDKDGKGHVTWGDVKAYAVGLAPGCLPVQSPCLGGGGLCARRRAAKPQGVIEA